MASLTKKYMLALAGLLFLLASGCKEDGEAKQAEPRSTGLKFKPSGEKKSYGTAPKLSGRKGDTIKLDGPREFFERTGQEPRVDALLFNAEAGSAWTLRYPHYQVVRPFPHTVQIPLVIPFALGNDPDMGDFLDNWLMLQRNDGTIERLFDYWILGKGV